MWRERERREREEAGGDLQNSVKEPFYFLQILQIYFRDLFESLNIPQWNECIMSVLIVIKTLARENVLVPCILLNVVKIGKKTIRHVCILLCTVGILHCLNYLWDCGST